MTVVSLRSILTAVVLCSALGHRVDAGQSSSRSQLDPLGKIHIPIGIANTVDTLKTFVEPESCFSPGVGSYGIYIWVYDLDAGRLYAATMDDVECEHWLPDGILTPFSKWMAGDVEVNTAVLQVELDMPEGPVQVVGCEVAVVNRGGGDRHVAVYAALRPVGPAGFDVKSMSVSQRGDALMVDGHTAIVSDTEVSAAAVLSEDRIGELALAGKTPHQLRAESAGGNCCGALRIDLTLGGGEEVRDMRFICPVLPGRRAVGHHWDGVAKWAQFDLAELNPQTGGRLQEDLGLDAYRELADLPLTPMANDYWHSIAGRVELGVPQMRWADAWRAILGHAAMTMNEGAPDVAVVNYNVFNRDGVYMANIFQKSGNFELAAEAIDYFTEHPFNGRSYPEADNPGQILWVMGQQWLFARDKQWVAGIYPAAKKIASMIEYYRATDEPHWVQMDALVFGDEVSEGKRRVLEPGRCDGKHPEYTEAFDIAGLRAAAMLAEVIGKKGDAAKWRVLADRFMDSYSERFAGDLSKDYGSYCVLWPCRLYELDAGVGYERFKGIGAQKPGGWRYFALARAHQGLLAGNREAGYKTLQEHLGHEQMRGWYAFDEGGKSGSGGWGRGLRTTWNGDVAMPHGWAIAELWLLMRDCLAYEDDGRLVLLSGLDPQWFTDPNGIVVLGLPTYFGNLRMNWKPKGTGAILILDGTQPPGGFVLALPKSLAAKVTVSGSVIKAARDSVFELPAGTRQVSIQFGN